MHHLCAHLIIFFVGLLLGAYAMWIYLTIIAREMYAPFSMISNPLPDVINFPQNAGITDLENRNKMPQQFSQSKVRWLHNRHGPNVNFPSWASY